MKHVLTLAALLVSLAAPALAEEATTAAPPQPGAEASAAPAAVAAPAILPAALPHSTPIAEEEPMSVPLEANSPPPARGGGCHHGSEQVYLTN